MCTFSVGVPSPQWIGDFSELPPSLQFPSNLPKGCVKDTDGAGTVVGFGTGSVGEDCVFGSSGATVPPPPSQSGCISFPSGTCCLLS